MGFVLHSVVIASIWETRDIDPGGRNHPEYVGTDRRMRVGFDWGKIWWIFGLLKISFDLTESNGWPQSFRFFYCSSSLKYQMFNCKDRHVVVSVKF